MLKIIITQRSIEDIEYPETRDALSHDWLRYIFNILPEALPFPIPSEIPDASVWAEKLGADAVILSNGENWGENAARDAMEADLYKWAVRHDVPVLGVCRGLQVINRINGGSGTSNIHVASGCNHVGLHKVEITSEMFAKIIGAVSFSVNSFHNEGVLAIDLAPKLKMFACAGSCIEGIYDPTCRVMAIQWHPERPMDDRQRVDLLIQKFLQGILTW